MSGPVVKRITATGELELIVDETTDEVFPCHISALEMLVRDHNALLYQIRGLRATLALTRNPN